MAHNKENPSIKAPQGIEERKKCMEVDQSDEETNEDPEETKGEDEVTMAQNEAFQDQQLIEKLTYDMNQAKNKKEMELLKQALIFELQNQLKKAVDKVEE